MTASVVPKGRALYFPIVEAEARQHGMPAEIADAVMRVESTYNPDVVGGVGERGLMQVLPSTAAMLGFRGTTDELAKPETNIRLGVRYLAGAWRRAGGDLCRTLMKYRAGHNEERMSPLSVEYCRRARVHLASIGSPLAGTVLPPVSVSPEASVRVAGAGLVQRGRRRAVSSSGSFWAAHQARVDAIRSRVHAKWNRRRLAMR